MSALDPFDLDEEILPRREKRTDRPLLVPPNGGDRIPYTRASTLSDFVSADFGLRIWERRLLAIGMGYREDLCGLAAGLPRLHAEKCDKKSLTRQQVNEDKVVNKQLDEIISGALESANAKWKANHGTAIHAFCAPDADISLAPSRLQPDIASWWTTAIKHNGIEILATEQFVANDELVTAGSFDHLVRHPRYGVVILDIKTGQIDGKDLSFGVQLSTYANAQAYDVYTDERSPLESLSGGEAINREVALVAHIPLGGGRTDLIEVDIANGYRAAKLASHVREARTMKLLTPCPSPLSQMSSAS